MVSHDDDPLDDPLIFAKPAMLEKIWMQITKLAVNKRGEALNPRVLVVYLGFEYRSVHEAERRGVTVKHTAKYVDECLDIVQLHTAKAVMTPLTEQKSLNLHDGTTMCDQVQHTFFRAVAGKLQNITGVGLDLMFVTKCLSYKLAPPTLADLTRAKKALRYWIGTRELDLFLTIPALKPNDLNRTLKHVTGEDRELLLCLAENRNCTSYPERNRTIIPDTRESSQQHSTRSGNETRSESQDETHSHEILVHSRFGISETADDVIGQD